MKSLLGQAQGILVPGGFGTRGVDGKMLAIRYAREKSVPFFGICFGMQLAAIEFARNVCGIHDATSREFFGDKRGGNIVIDIDDIVITRFRKIFFGSDTSTNFSLGFCFNVCHVFKFKHWGS